MESVNSLLAARRPQLKRGRYTDFHAPVSTRGFVISAKRQIMLQSSALVIALASCARDAGVSTADIAARSASATATVLAIGANNDTVAQGSAFIVRQDGVLITNFHVLRGASRAIVVLASKERFDRVRVIDADSSLDLALLKVPGAGLATIPAVTLEPRPGDRVVAIGSPLGLTNTVSEGIVSAVRVVAGHQLIQITAPISPGSSGGVVLDMNGNAIAVSTSYLKSGQALNFAVPVKYAIGMLNDHPSERSVAEVFAANGVNSDSLAPTIASLNPLLARDGRWIEITTTKKVGVWVDSVTLTGSRADTVTGWLRWLWKATQYAADGTAYTSSEQTFLITCRDHKLMVGENLAYNKKGDVVYKGDGMESATAVVPNSVGESILEALCIR